MCQITHAAGTQIYLCIAGETEPIIQQFLSQQRTFLCTASASGLLHSSSQLWVIWHKFKALFMKKPYSMYENKIVRDYRDGKVTKEQLDRCSTCDQNAKVNDGLSAASRAQLAHQTGEEIVDADIARQTVEQKKQQ